MFTHATQKKNGDGRKMKKRILAGLGIASIALVTACSAPSISTTSTPSTTTTSSAVTTAPPAVVTTTPVVTTPTTPAMTVSQQQAVDAAQNYLSLGSGFSYNGLLKQLTSSYGSGFSQSDAEFAINYLHPDWDTQAVDAAQGYMKLGGFSRDSMIQQLTSSYGSGFTYNQAVYAVNKIGL